MAEKYLLGKNAVRKLGQMFRSGNGIDRVPLSSGGITDVLEWPDPWTVQYAASVVSNNTTGHWIVWIPSGSWPGVNVETTSGNQYYLAPAGGDYPSGWYVFPSSVEGSISANGTTSIYVSDRDGKISITAAPGDVKIAEIICNNSLKSKDVRQICRSTVFSMSFPWTFNCTVGSQGARTGGWSFCRIMLGSEILTDDDFTGLNNTADGYYYVEINISAKTGVLKIANSGVIPDHDFANGKINIYVGHVVSAVNVDKIRVMPVIPMYV